MNFNYSLNFFNLELSETRPLRLQSAESQRDEKAFDTRTHAHPGRNKGDGFYRGRVASHARHASRRLASGA